MVALQVLLLVRELLTGSVGLPEALAGLGYLDIVLESVPMLIDQSFYSLLHRDCPGDRVIRVNPASNSIGSR